MDRVGPDPPEDPRIAVIGAGVAGLACAGALHHAGIASVCYDKGRGFGGRTSTRRTEVDGLGTLSFDHGAPWFEARSEGFATLAARCMVEGVAAEWPHPGALVALPSMSALTTCLGRGLDVRFGVRIAQLRREDDDWVLVDEGGAELGPFAALAVAVPQPQAAALLAGAVPEIATRLVDVPWHPCWTLMLALRRGPAAPADEIVPDGGVLERIVQDSAKPGRRPPPDVRTFVAHATSAWSAAHLEEEDESVAALLRDATLAALGADPADVVHHVAHRWRFARCAAPLRVPCLVDARMGVVACGDGYGGKDVDAAWTSGGAAAAALRDLLAAR